MSPSRRHTLQWMIAATAAPMAPWMPAAMAAGRGTAPPFDAIADWPTAIPQPVSARGYGRDPNLMEPVVPWPLTLSKTQRATIDLLGDLILPADARSPGAGQLGVGAFVDEWISAPYPMQRGDRTTVISGLLWLDAQSGMLHQAAFAAITSSQRARLLDTLTVVDPIERMIAPVAFFDRLRYLFVLGFYSLPEGKADMGLIGDKPTAGDYPGPTAEALTHLAQIMNGMGLTERKS